MKRFSKLFIAIPLMFGAISLTACSFFDNLANYFGEKNESTVYAKGMTLSKNDLQGSLNNSYKLECIFTPTNTTNKNATWSSSNTDVCTVNDGVVNCVGLGNATITAVSEDGGFSDTCHVTVTKKEMHGLSLSRNTATLKPGKSRTLTVVFNPTDCSDKEVEWLSNSSAVTVNQDGVITADANAHDGDTAIITVRAKNYMYSDTCEVTVLESGADIDKSEINWTYMDYSKKSAYGSTYCPSTGNVKLLVIPVWFTDSAIKTGLDSTKRETVREDIRKAYFGTQTETGWNSVKTFYETESTEEGENLLTLSGTVSDWYECGFDSEVLKSDDGQNSNTASFAKTATKWYFDNHPSDNRKNYDSNGDGYIDGVMLIYAYPDYGTLRNNNYSNYWAYCHWCHGSSNTSAPNPDVYFWASYDFMYGNNYKVGNFAGGDNTGSVIDSHTYIHEMGHVFGLDDYYDYSDQKNPSGCFSMQDYNVGGHDPYSMMALGWVKPYIPTDSCEIKIKPFQTNHDLILLTPQWNTYGSPFDEYILLEYYSPTGLNALDTAHKYKGSIIGPNDYGIRVWHVDARVIGWMGGTMYNVEPSTLGSNINLVYPILHAFRNTYYSANESTNGYASPLGAAYSEYNLLQLIRNSETAEVFKCRKNQVSNETLSSADLFKQGDQFTISKFKKQFVNGNSNTMNSGLPLGFTFNVKTLTNSEATIEITAL